MYRLCHHVVVTSIDSSTETKPPCQFIAKIGEDVAIHIRRADHIKRVRCPDHQCRHGIDDYIIDFNFWIVLCNCADCVVEQPVCHF